MVKIQLRIQNGCRGQHDRGEHWLEAQESQGLASSISKADGGGKTDKKSC